MLLLDTNIILRFILNDHPTLSVKAKEIMLAKKFYLDQLVIAECIWVLLKVYSHKKSDVVNYLDSFCKNPLAYNPNKKFINDVMSFYKTHNLSYIDCYLHCLAESKGIPLATFETKLSKLK
jgi:predicted nucleic-acid-binding protein